MFEQTETDIRNIDATPHAGTVHLNEGEAAEEYCCMLKSSHTKQGPPKNHQAVRQTRNRDSEVDRVLIKQNGTVVVAY